MDTSVSGVWYAALRVPYEHMDVSEDVTPVIY